MNTCVKISFIIEISCFSTYYYTVFFRGGNFDSWMQSLLRASMIFINFRRRNYDKATLTQLSDLLFHVSDNTDLAEKMQEFLQVFTEKKIEILHSILRRQENITLKEIFSDFGFLGNLLFLNI